jgi:hypothetical protein
MKVPLIDLSGQHQSLLADLLDAVARLIDSQEFGAVFSRLTKQQHVGEVLSKFVVAARQPVGPDPQVHHAQSVDAAF